VTRRLLILERLAALAAVVTRANGFASDAGLHVYLGAAPELGPDDPDEAIAIVPREDVASEPNYQNVDLPVEIQAIAKATLTEPWIAVEALLGAIKLAIELEDRTLGSLLKGRMTRVSTRTLERPPGSTTIGLGVTYRCPYVEPWGDPAIGVPAEEST
jgi:hypothetical protein